MKEHNFITKSLQKSWVGCHNLVRIMDIEIEVAKI